MRKKIVILLFVLICILAGVYIYQFYIKKPLSEPTPNIPSFVERNRTEPSYYSNGILTSVTDTSIEVKFGDETLTYEVGEIPILIQQPGKTKWEYYMPKPEDIGKQVTFAAGSKDIGEKDALIIINENEN